MGLRTWPLGNRSDPRTRKRCAVVQRAHCEATLFSPDVFLDRNGTRAHQNNHDFLKMLPGVVAAAAADIDTARGGSADAPDVVAATRKSKGGKVE